MRGDSLRDLYAKTLALLGLGLLAGVGALVDYWPVGVGTPQVTSASLAVPEAPPALAAINVAIPFTPAAPVEPAPVAAANLALFAIASGGIPASGRRLVLSEPVVPAVATPVAPLVDSAVALRNPAVEIALNEPAAAPGPDFDPALVYQVGGGEDNSGLLSDAVDMMKSTGSTIARGGAATGASIVGAFRVVSGAFRKLKFF